ncbi:MAG TPA: hypothetical protein VHB93_01465 [Candidatus Paceibacterota bacterium]|nr:hypothetical protein [Candidatus Paceibacterota bacterium]
MADYIVDHRSTQQQIIDLVESGVDRYGHPLRFDEFIEGANRRGDVFFKEIERGVRLKLMPKTRHVRRLTRGVRFTMYELKYNIVWHEVMRSWPNGKVARKIKNYTVSETCELTDEDEPEEFDDAALRCLLQELKHLWKVWNYTPTKDDLMQIATYDYHQARRVERLGGHPTIGLPKKPEEPTVMEPVYWSETWIGLQTETEAKSYPLILDLLNPPLSLKEMAKEDVYFFKDVDDQIIQNGLDPSRDDPKANWVQIFLRADKDIESGT